VAWDGWTRDSPPAWRDWVAASGRPGVTVVTVDGNTASAAVAERAGFTLVETVEDEHRGSPATLHRWRWTRS
jgi:RimJ/RimL family protein N-acetyltransferase